MALHMFKVHLSLSSTAAVSSQNLCKSEPWDLKSGTKKLRNTQLMTVTVVGLAAPVPFLDL